MLSITPEVPRRDSRGTCVKCAWHRRVVLPPLLAGESLVEKGEHLGHVELDVFEVELVLVVLLHLEQVVELEVQLQEPAVSAWIR